MALQPYLRVVGGWVDGSFKKINFWSNDHNFLLCRKSYSIGFVFLKNHVHMTFRSFSIKFWKTDFLQKFYSRNTADTQIDRFEFLLYFCCKFLWKFLQNFRFSKFDRKWSKSRMIILFKENKTNGIGLSAKEKIFDIGPKINFLKDPSTHPPLRRVDKAVGPFSKRTLWNGFIWLNYKNREIITHFSKFYQILVKILKIKVFLQKKALNILV